MLVPNRPTLAYALGLAYRTFRPAVFRLDGETAHDATLLALTLIERVILQTRCAPRPFTHPALRIRLFGIDFPNPVGLAAGLDKNGQAPHVWPLLGFGFVELGTFTAQPQPGNPKPRLFRLPEERALVNRMGFNNTGADAAAQMLARAFSRLAPRTPVGLNIGKSRDVALDEAAEDYARSFRKLAPWADYVCVNVSSPNTPGLRALQERKQLQLLLGRLQEENQKFARQTRSTPRPLLIKVAPDLDDADLEDVVALAREHNIAGLVATNTTVDLKLCPGAARFQEGGLSGAPLRARSTDMIRKLARWSQGDIPIVGVGGIFSAADAYEKIRAGASLVQLYTGLVFEGPDLPQRICEGLVRLLEADGFRQISEAVGCDLEF